jgi:DNA-directed RNA polymerase delta subunit
MFSDNKIQTILSETKNDFSLEDITKKICQTNNKKFIKSTTKSKIQQFLLEESKKKDGTIILLSDNKYALRKEFELDLKKRVLNQIKEQGFKIDDNNLIYKPSMNSKKKLRRFHDSACYDKYTSNLNFIKKNEKKLIKFLANGNEINIDNIEPELRVVQSETIESDLFRYTTLLWSVPVSNGFGRRTRFLLIDKNNEKLIGIFALGDPVFNLSCRDNWIGWNHRDRADRLYNTMDIFILGAVPPYNYLLGGKLVAMVATTNEVRKIISTKYFSSKTIIRNENKNSELVLLTTGSALGRSSIYARIKFHDRLLYQPIGLSVGWGHFHLNNGLFDSMRRYLELTEPKMASLNRFGQGPNWKIRTARYCLSKLGLPVKLLKHGIQREIYGIPLAKNFAEYLRGETEEIDPISLPFNKITDFWRKRWLLDRAERKPEYRNHKTQDVLKMVHRFGKINDSQKQL